MNAFNGDGLSADGSRHNNTDGFWASNGGSPSNQWVRVRFNAAYPLDYLRIWNYNEAGYEAESLKSADVYVLNSDVDPGNNLHLNDIPFNATGWTLWLTNQLFAPAPIGPETNTDPDISLGGVTARQLAFKINANYSTSDDPVAALSEVQIYSLGTTAPSLANAPANDIATNGAVFNGLLACSGAVYNVYACWNTTNGGANLAGWANSVYVGTWTNTASASLSFSVTALTPNTTYYSTFLATNALDTLWATNVQSFTTLTMANSIITFIITPSAGVGAAILPGTPQTVTNGDNATFTIIASTGYDIGNVLVDNISQGVSSSYTFTNVTANHTINANFGMIPPVLSANSLTVPGGVPSFVILNSLSGHQYTLVYKNNLTDLSWTPLPGLGTLVGTGGTITLVDTNAIISQTQRFYRIQMQ